MKQNTEKMHGVARRLVVAALAVVAMFSAVLGVAKPAQAKACVDADGNESSFLDCQDDEQIASDKQCGNAGFLGFRPWFKGLAVVTDGGKKCAVGRPAAGDTAMTVYIWTIILNVLVDIFSVAGFLAVLMIIYGGYFYITAGGDPSKVAKGKKIIIAAVSGLVVVILASVISNGMISVLQGALK